MSDVAASYTGRYLKPVMEAHGKRSTPARAAAPARRGKAKATS